MSNGYCREPMWPMAVGSTCEACEHHSLYHRTGEHGWCIRCELEDLVEQLHVIVDERGER